MHLCKKKKKKTQHTTRVTISQQTICRTRSTCLCWTMWDHYRCWEQFWCSQNNKNKNFHSAPWLVTYPYSPLVNSEARCLCTTKWLFFFNSPCLGKRPVLVYYHSPLTCVIGIAAQCGKQQLFQRLFPYLQRQLPVVVAAFPLLCGSFPSYFIYMLSGTAQVAKNIWKVNLHLCVHVHSLTDTIHIPVTSAVPAFFRATGSEPGFRRVSVLQWFHFWKCELIVSLCGTREMW